MSMCGSRVVRSNLRPPGVEPEVDLFVRILREVHGDASWDEVERSACSAWRRVGQITGHDWEAVRDAVKRTWGVSGRG